MSDNYSLDLDRLERKLDQLIQENGILLRTLAGLNDSVVVLQQKLDRVASNVRGLVERKST